MQKRRHVSVLECMFILSVAFTLFLIVLGLRTDDGPFAIGFISVVFLLPILIFFPLGFRLIRFISLKRKLRQTIIAEYDIPAKLTPPEIGFLYDVKFGDNEIYAILASLEQRQFIVFDPNTKAYHVPPSADIANYTWGFDRALLTVIDGKQITKSFVKDMREKISTATYNNLVSRQLMHDNLRKGYRIRVVFMTLLEIVVAFSILSLLFITDSTLDDKKGAVGGVLFLVIIGSPIFALLSLFMTHLYTRINGLRWVGTKELRKLWPQIEGFRVFIQEAYGQELRYQSEDTRQKITNDMLPYAIALGIKTHWEDKFD